MDTFDAINQRWSVKAFDQPHHFTGAEETQLLAAAIQPAMPKGGQLALSAVVVQDRFVQ